MNKVVLLILAIAVAAFLAVRHAPLDPLPATSPRLSPLDGGLAVPGGLVGAGASAAITMADLQARVRVLASDEMEGRRTGEPGAERAAHYLETEFRRFGLGPGGDGGSYRQRFVAQLGARPGEKNRLTLLAAGRSLDLALDREWRPFAFATPTRGQLRAPVVFCGYGITSRDPAYDDYAGQDVAGKVVLLFRFEPGVDDSLSPFDGTRLTVHADLRNKAKNALDHGAIGVLAVTPPGQRDDLLPFDGSDEAGSGHLPAAQIRSDVLARALAGVDLVAAASRIDANVEPASFPLDLEVAMTIDVEPVTGEAWNVVGILGGSDPDSQATAIVLGAHYDHLGRGGRGSMAPGATEIHNGADDNASGVAALLEIAGAMASEEAPARSIVFAAFTGEEMGLLGSSRYVEDPPWPIASTRAMINLDMIGRGPEHQIQVSGVGTSPRFHELVATAAAAEGLTPVFNEGGYGPSDHTPFYAQNLPVLFFFTAPHEDYHRPSDDWEKLDYPFLESATRLAAKVTGDLARVAPIEFTRADGGLPRGGERGGEGYGGRGYGPYLGTVPDFTPVERGIRLSGVREGSPAEAAGIRGGDIIVGWEGRPILNMKDYSQALKSHRPGDRVEISILRNSKEISVMATLAERR